MQSICVRPSIQSDYQNQFFTVKVRTFWQNEVKISVLALWLGALSLLFHNMGVGGYGCYPLFVCARHVQRCVKKCPHFKCVIHRFVLALNAGTITLYTRLFFWPFWPSGCASCPPGKVLATPLTTVSIFNVFWWQLKLGRSHFFYDTSFQMLHLLTDEALTIYLFTYLPISSVGNSWDCKSIVSDRECESY